MVGKVAEELDISTLISKKWFTSTENSSIWYTAFQVITNNPLVKKYELLEFADVNCIIINGSLKYYKIDDNAIEISHTNCVLPAPEFKISQEGIWLLLISPYKIDGIKINEVLIKDRIKSYASLFSIVFGENVIYKQLFENVINCETGIPTVSTVTILNPNSSPYPTINTETLIQINNIVEAKFKLNEKERNKVDSSLTWYFDSLKDMGTSSFLKTWVAIEILALNDSNIKPIKEIIYRIYDKPLNDDNELYMIGKLYSIRGDIVHNGSKRPIHGLLLKYIQSIYIDILFEILGLESKHFAKTLIEEKKINLYDIINYNKFD